MERRKPGSLVRRGFLLVEGALSLGILAIIGVLLLQLSLSILQPRQWTMQQAVSDAYVTYERALAERVPFNDAIADGSPWPEFPATASDEVEMGRLPGGRLITATVTRTRIPDPNNLPQHGGTGTEITNPAAMKVWRLQSVVSYQVGRRTYYKSRTVLRHNEDAPSHPQAAPPWHDAHRADARDHDRHGCGGHHARAVQPAARLSADFQHSGFSQPRGSAGEHAGRPDDRPGGPLPASRLGGRRAGGEQPAAGRFAGFVDELPPAGRRALYYHLVPESGILSDPEWFVTDQVADVRFSIEQGVLRMRLTGMNGEQITYSGTMQQ